MSRGLNVLVVGKDGVGYEKEDWTRSNTFRIGEQKNLLVADNQTRLFKTADAETKRRLAACAWGARAQ